MFKEMKEAIAENYLTRKASLEDADLLAQLSHTIFVETFAHLNSAANMKEYLSKNCTKANLVEELMDTSSAFLLAYSDDEPAGFAKLRWSEIPEEIKTNSAIEIQRLYVLKRMIGKRLGKMLIEECFEIARQKDFNIIWLGVWEHNVRAIAFYKHFGFEIIGSQIFELGRDKQTDFLMKKIL